MTRIIILAFAIFGVQALREVLGTLQSLLRNKISYNGLMRVRCDLFRKLQELSASYHRSQPQGDAIYRVSYDTFGFQSMLGLATSVLLNVLTLVTMAWIMFSLNWRLTLISLSVAPLLVLTIRLYGKVLADRSTAAHETDAEFTTTLQRGVSTISLVQAFGREAEEYSRFHNSVRNSVKTWLQLYWHEMMYWFWIAMILGVSGAAVTGYGGYLIFKGVMTVGGLTYFIDYLRNLYEPLSALSGTGSSIAGGMAGVKRVFEVLDLDPVIRDAPDAISLPRQARVLTLDNVGFEYLPGTAVVEGINVCVKPGEMAAFVGSSGVEKPRCSICCRVFTTPPPGRSSWMTTICERSRSRISGNTSRSSCRKM